MDTATLARARYLSLTTFKRDGTPVSTPFGVTIRTPRTRPPLPAAAADITREQEEMEVR